MEYNHGRIEPYPVEGIVFYQVGRNASHEFYAGAKDGRRYTFTSGEDYDEDGNFRPDKRVYEVEKWGYMGHY